MSDSFPKGQSECISAKGWDSFSTQSLLPKKKRGRVFKPLVGPKYTKNMEPAAEKIQRHTLCKEGIFLY